MRTSERFLWISIVCVIFIFWWLFTTVNAPWWIISLTIALGVLAWLQTHESSRVERYYTVLLVIVVISTLYHRSFGVKRTLQEGYTNGPNINDPKAPNMKVSDLEAQIANLENQLKNSSHHETKPDEVSSQILKQFLSTPETVSRPSVGNIEEGDLSATLGKDEKKMPGENVSLDKYTPAQAQRATYQLVDTVQQLKETMTNLGPILKEGKQVMSMFENMNLGDTMKQLEKLGDGDSSQQMEDFMKMMKK